MSDLALHLVERVIPEVPVRESVCSLPFRLRYPCGYDRELCAEVLGAFVGELRRLLAWRAKRALALPSVADAQTGTITFVQRFDSGLRLNVHFHVLSLDGIYVRDAESGAHVFHALAAPTEDEVRAMARAAAPATDRMAENRCSGSFVIERTTKVRWTIVDGKVYLSTFSNELVVYGLLE